MKYENVSVKEEGSVTHVHLDRPSRRNALDGQTLDELKAAFDEAVSSGNTRVLVLGGEGPVFCAGADIDWMRQEGARTREENRTSSRQLAALYEFLDTLPIPLVARVHGAAIGGGVGLVAICDIAVASDSTLFALSEVRLGLVPAVVSPYVLTKIGVTRARDAFLTARRFTASEALSWGLVHRLVPESDLEEAVEGVTRDLLQGGPEALRRAKELIREVSGKTPKEVCQFTASCIAETRASAEAQSGLEAYLTRQRPPWARKD